jgi:NADH:ubiquinone oxidoreductase subunit E
LHKVQDHFGFLNQERMAAVAQLMQIPMANVSGVASFYHYFRLKPAGKYMISVCTGTACYIKGAEALVNKVKEMLSIEPGDTTTDGMFTLDVTRCLGTCALAPIVKVGDHVYPCVTPDQIPLIIEECLKKK